MLRINTLPLIVPALMIAYPIQAQFSFTNATSLKSSTTNSGGCVGVVDMNGDGLDDMCILDQSRTLRVDHQNSDGSFNLVTYGIVSDDEDQWGMAIGDMDNDGFKDVLTGGYYDGVHHLRITGMGQSTLADLNNGSLYMQCNNVADINNDGHNDFFACNDHAEPRQWINNGSGLLQYADIIDYSSDPPSDGSGNYGSVWTDFDNDGDLDLYIAKCRQGVNNPEDPRRWNRLFVNDGNGNYSDQAGEYGALIKNQSWTADFGDIDNDGDMDLVITNHDTTIQLFENDGTGHFTEITSGSGLEHTGFFLQSKFVDLDNDGFLDLLITGGTARLYRNNGNSTFSTITFNDVFPAAKTMHSFATGDLNNDGFQDVFASYGDTYVSPNMSNPDRLWLNDGNDNHWLTVRLQGTESNRDAIGARVTITGPWGTQIREVRAGESYGIVTSFACSFGLGAHEVIPEVMINWPSGQVDVLENVQADQTITVIEGICVSPQVEITSEGPFILCSGGDPLTISANPGYEYLWNTEETTQSIDITEPGSYSVTISDGEGCTATASVFVVEDPDETPVITTSGPTTFCEGDEVVLSSSPAAGYSWTGGGSGQTLVVDEAGAYTVTIDGVCGQFTSAPIEVEVLDAPDPPLVPDVHLQVPGQAMLEAEGEMISWYDVPVGGTPVATGNQYMTPVIDENTSFWATAGVEHGGGSAQGAKSARSAQFGQYHTNADNYQHFTAFEPFYIRSVRVYANGAGNRNIGLIDRSNGSTVQSQVINIPNGESVVDLDFLVPEAGDYALRVMSGNPQLWRDGIGSAQSYPYALGTVGTMTSSSASGNNATAYYYFFYDWEVEEMSTMCESERTEVLVTVGGVGVGEATGATTRVWPNPATDMLTITLGDEVNGELVMDLFDITGRRVSTTVSEREAGGGVVLLPVSGLARGEYVLHLQHASGSSTHRVIVQ